MSGEEETDQPVPAKRGRPVGWRKEAPRSHRLSLQLTEDELRWLTERAAASGEREIEIVRELIEAERAREKRKRRPKP